MVHIGSRDRTHGSEGEKNMDVGSTRKVEECRHDLEQDHVVIVEGTMRAKLRWANDDAAET